jgi:hypothetical protein
VRFRAAFARRASASAKASARLAVARAARERRRSASRAASLAGVAAIVVFATIASAQIGGKPATGNPTPGVAQPEPPNLADRVTFTGCLQPVNRRADPSGSATASADLSAPSNSRFELTKAERVDRVPAGTGGSPATTNLSSTVYRLEGIESQFSPFVGAKVEISGEIKGPAGASPPTLLVEFVQRVAVKCP